MVSDTFDSIGRKIREFRHPNVSRGTYWWWWAFARHPRTNKMKFMVDGSFGDEGQAYDSANLLLAGQEFEVFSTNSKNRNEATRRARQLFAEKNRNINIALQNASHQVHNENIQGDQ